MTVLDRTPLEEVMGTVVGSFPIDPQIASNILVDVTHQCIRRRFSIQRDHHLVGVNLLIANLCRSSVCHSMSCDVHLTRAVASIDFCCPQPRR